MKTLNWEVYLIMKWRLYRYCQRDAISHIAYWIDRETQTVSVIAPTVIFPFYPGRASGEHLDWVENVLSRHDA